MHGHMLLRRSNHSSNNCCNSSHSSCLQQHRPLANRQIVILGWAFVPDPQIQVAKQERDAWMAEQTQRILGHKLTFTASHEVGVAGLSRLSLYTFERAEIASAMLKGFRKQQIQGPRGARLLAKPQSAAFDRLTGAPAKALMSLCSKQWPETKEHCKPQWRDQEVWLHNPGEPGENLGRLCSGQIDTEHAEIHMYIAPGADMVCWLVENFRPSQFFCHKKVMDLTAYVVLFFFGGGGFLGC